MIKNQPVKPERFQQSIKPALWISNENILLLSILRWRKVCALAGWDPLEGSIGEHGDGWKSWLHHKLRIQDVAYTYAYFVGARKHLRSRA